MRDHPDGTKILVIGILSLVCCGLLGPVALFMGQSARKQMAAQPQVMWTNGGSVTAGWVLGIIASCLLALGVLYFVVFAVAVG